jgi:hypothetical protein
MGNIIAQVETISFESVLHDIQMELKAPKGQINSHGRYKYRSCEDIIAAVKLVLPKESYLNFKDEIVLIGTRYFVKSIAKFTYGSKSIESNALVELPTERKGFDAMQLTCTTSSYARKTALSGLFICDDNPDTESGNSEESKIKKEKATEAPIEPKQTEYVTPLQVSAMQELISQAGYIEGKVMDHYKVNGWATCEAWKYPKIMQAMKKKIEEQGK